MSKFIISESSTHVIYKGPTEAEILYYFTDTYECPLTGQTVMIPGKGAVCNRISAFFFARLKYLGIQSHFTKTVSMRESLMAKTTEIPFSVLARCYPSETLCHSFNLESASFFERPILEYKHLKTKTMLNESHLMAFQWMSIEEVEELQLFVWRVCDSLKAMLLGFGFLLLEIQLNLAYASSELGGFVLVGEISPETFSVADIQTGRKLGREHVLQSLEKTPTTSVDWGQHYREVAVRMGLQLSGPGISCVLPFERKKK